MENGKRGVSEAAVKRLPKYYRQLCALLAEGETRVSSDELSRRMRCTPSQIRQDLNALGRFRQQGFGYNVDALQNGIKAILGLTRDYNIIVVGAGDTGRAIVNAQKFLQPRFNIVAMFDVDPALAGIDYRGVPSYHADEILTFVQSNRVDIAALTLPKEDAPDMMASLTAAGVTGIWDFTGSDLQPGDGAVVESMDLTESLMMMSYKINHRKDLP